jgi:hypothetical protein
MILFFPSLTWTGTTIEKDLGQGDITMRDLKVRPWMEKNRKRKEG